MVSNFQVQRAVVILATVIMTATLLSGCVSDTPRTQLDWFPKDNRVATVTPTPKPVKKKISRPPVQTASLDCPTPRPTNKPGWYDSDLPPVTQPATYTPAPAGGGLSFAWPVQGRITADYGATVNGGRNDGINIGTALGAPIHAAAAGQVSYVGNELRGYGNLILIKHDDGYVTVYAHADRISVNRGDYVAKGQVIGYAGQTGDVTSPQLHFEIRKGSTPLNPHGLLATARAS
jgi:murein DD-endopeptidase MepM/ murein hydrolase activator NlpD